MNCLSSKLLIGVCTFLCACTSRDYLQEFQAASYQAPTTTTRTVLPQNYKTNVGDTLDVFVLEDSSFNGKYVIRPSGDIILSKVGRINVVSKSLADAEAEIRRTLESSQIKKATVIVDPVVRGSEMRESELTGLVIYMSGSVGKPGRKFVPFVGGQNVTALQAVMDSGGFTSFASKRKAYVLRRDVSGVTQRIPVNFSKIEAGRAPDVPLKGGDMLVVPEKIFGL